MWKTLKKFKNYYKCVVSKKSEEKQGTKYRQNLFWNSKKFQLIFKAFKNKSKQLENSQWHSNVLVVWKMISRQIVIQRSDVFVINFFLVLTLFYHVRLHVNNTIYYILNDPTVLYILDLYY